MPWRVIAHGDQVWHVDALAERPANAEAWQLVLSFRSASERPRPAVWTPVPPEGQLEASTVIPAERHPDHAPLPPPPEPPPVTGPGRRRFRNLRSNPW